MRNLKSFIIIFFIILGTNNIGKCVDIGKASYYGTPFHGRKTASGEVFDMNKLTAAHNIYRFGTYVRVTNLSNGKQVIVKINDTGGFKKYGRIIDLSREAAKQIDMIQSGVAKVKIEVIETPPNS